MAALILNELDYWDSILYYPVLVIVLVIAGFYFTGRTGFVQLRMFGESIRVVMEKPQQEKAISSFQALMVSTASRVGTGNIIGISTAICLGGPGSVFGCGSWPSSAAPAPSLKARLLRSTNAAAITATATAVRPITSKRLCTAGFSVRFLRFS